MNLFSQSQDPGASQTLEGELESQCCPAVTVDDVIRLSNVRSLYVWGEPEVRRWVARWRNQNTWRWFCYQLQNEVQTCTTDSLSSCVADYEKTSE